MQMDFESNAAYVRPIKRGEFKEIDLSDCQYVVCSKEGVPYVFTRHIKDAFEVTTSKGGKLYYAH